jgi:signal transduction histidine kinase
MTPRLRLYLGVFTLLNLTLVPLMSLYGLRICPVLSVAGFTFGCYYSATYVGIVTLLNLLFVGSLSRHQDQDPTTATVGRPMLWYALIYLLASGIALIVLQGILQIQHLSSLSRAPEVLLLASLLLAIVQGYGLHWAHAPRQKSGTVTEVEPGLRHSWVTHSLRDFFPAMVGFLVMIHFLLRQSESVNVGHIAPINGADELINHTLYLILFVVSWLAVTYFFHIGSELDQVSVIEDHLHKVEAADFQHQTDTRRTWGLWKALSGQLNRFSRQIGDNAQRIKSLTEEKLAAQADALTQKQRAIEVLTQHRAELEKAVDERTRALIDTQKKLVASEKMAALGVFTAGMAHEINNPANFVAVGAQNARAQLDEFSRFLNDLMDPEADPEIRTQFAGHFSKIGDSLEVVHGGIRRIESVVRQLRAHHPEGDPGRQDTDIIAVLESAWRWLSASLRTPVRLSTDFGSREQVCCAVSQIEQVFLALLTNAIHGIEDAIPHRADTWQGEVHLASHAEASHLVITVTDNGIGISDEHVDRIFDAFFTTKTVGRGAGLGLSMARDVILEHGGQLEVSSTRHVGATAIVRLPLIDQENC